MRDTTWTYQPGRTRVQITAGGGIYCLCGISEKIIRCIYTKRDSISEESPIGVTHDETAVLHAAEDEAQSALLVSTSFLTVKIDLRTMAFTWIKNASGEVLLREGGKELTDISVPVWTTGDEAPVVRRVKTVDGERNFIENLKPVEDHMAYRAKLYFRFVPGEGIHGLGQGEEGIYNYRGHTQYLYQHNMRIPIPWMLSDRGYAILADCGSLMAFNDDERGSYLFMDTVSQLDYYFTAGDSFPELIRSFRHLTGKAAMLPRWAFGYVQSKERYRTQEELVSTAARYRELGVGLDCIVQDWKTWRDDNWGEKLLDQSRFPDMKKAGRQLHDMHVHAMVSIWPNMNYNTVDCMEMREEGHLLSDLATYDAFDADARRLYWKQAKRELFDGGFDAWWCDSTEPFSGPDWGGETKREPWERFALVGNEHKKYLGAGRANLYALAHAQGIYENQRLDAPEKRVVNLTRSGYPGIQKYGAVLWSGDTCATWETMRIQLTEALNMALSGIPYWTLDIGAFFTVKENWRKRGCECHNDPAPKWFWQGDFENGVDDLGYRELYVRWLQWGTFLPMMRSHGTDTPREIWYFGKSGEVFYDAIKESIDLRYRLMPYIYSLAGSVWHDDALMLRPLLMEFPDDPASAACDCEFMLGDALLVCPVTKPMLYGPGNVPLSCAADGTQETLPAAAEDGIQETLPADHTHGRFDWACYLPAGCSWYDTVTGVKYAGGQTVSVNAPLSRTPVFAREGSIIPEEEGLQYADQKADTPLRIRICPGRDASFVYYEDDGDGYAYERGIYNRIRMQWDDAGRTLTIGKSVHPFDNGLAGRPCVLICGDEKKAFVYTGEGMNVSL